MQDPVLCKLWNKINRTPALCLSARNINNEITTPIRSVPPNLFLLSLLPPRLVVMASLLPASLLHLLLLLLICLPVAVQGVGVFSVQRKFAGNDNPPIDELRKHNAMRRSLLAKPEAIDLPLGGDVSGIGLYYTEIAIGTPPKKFTVQVDTGSDVLYVNCQPCTGCTENATIRAQLTMYDPKDSKTAQTVPCYDSLCKTLVGPQMIETMLADPSFTNDMPCPFFTHYFDGVAAYGSYMTDIFTYNQVLGDDKTLPANANITFGCASRQKITEQQQALRLTGGVDGIIGFSQTNRSVISQLASSGKARKIFAHCLDTNKGGGIFAIGHVVEPKVRTTPLVPNMPFHFDVNMKSIQVGKEFLQLPTNLFETGDGRGKGTTIDSGSTTVVLPPIAFRPLLEMIFSNHPSLSLKITDNSATFSKYSGSKSSVDKDFPDVTFHFENSLTLNVKPHDYLSQEKGIWHVGFESLGEMGNTTILGDIALSNKLVVYDFEKQTVGWEEYDCTSSITIEDGTSGKAYKVGAHNVSPQFPSSSPSPSPSPSPSTS